MRDRSNQPLNCTSHNYKRGKRNTPRFVEITLSSQRWILRFMKIFVATRVTLIFEILSRHGSVKGGQGAFREYKTARGLAKSHYAEGQPRSSLILEYARCVVLSIAATGTGAKGGEYFEQQRFFDQNLSKGLVGPLWPAFRIGITCYCDQNGGCLRILTFRGIQPSRTIRQPISLIVARETFPDPISG